MTTGAGRSPTTTSRRRILRAAVGAAAAATTGCVQRMRSLANRRTPNQLSLTIRTLPADADPSATRIARALAENLETVGIDVDVILMTEDELRRTVLINHTYDIYIDRYPDHVDPDFLRPLLASVFSEEPGWQNPFGFSNLEIDRLLDEQRTSQGSARETAVFELQRAIARHQPFTIIGFADEIRAVRTDRFVGWTRFDPISPVNYLALERPPIDRSSGPPDDQSLRVTTTDERITNNFNPIAVEFRSRGPFTGLLYDPLARRFGGMIRPWLAATWAWETTESAETAATVHLRDNLTWHDGRSLSATDVAFTYRFLADTALGSRESPVPAPRFRGRISLVNRVEVRDDQTVRFRFGTTSPEVAARALTVPVLPAHEWQPKATESDIAGIDLFEGVTEALIWTNQAPIGSGPVAFERSIADEMVRFSRFDGHFLTRDPPEELAQFIGTGVAFDELRVRVAPSDDAAVELVAADEADATTAGMNPAVVPRIGRSTDVALHVGPSRSFYHIGFNARRTPLGNPRFRRAVARLVDKPHLIDEVFDGYATPAATPLGDTDWVPSDLSWEGADPEVPFAGANGELDVDAAMAAFREAGFRYNNDGQLLGQ